MNLYTMEDKVGLYITKILMRSLVETDTRLSYLDTDARSTDSGVDTFATTTSAPYTFGCRGSRQVVGNDRDIIVYAWTSIPVIVKLIITPQRFI